MTTPSPGKSLRILVVDDVALMRRVVTSLLRKVGITEIFEAGGAQEALSQLRAHKPDVVISDWNMPEMSGLDLLQAMRKDAAMKGIPFLLVTAKGEQSDIDQAKRAGVNGYLQKPFDVRAFEAEINKISIAKGR